jgi:DNA-binding SARP family transcriptional activator
MPRYLFVIGIFLITGVKGSAQSYGLAFNSHEAVMEKRTSLDLSPDDSLCFTKNFELRFDLRFMPDYNSYFGYVLRIVSNDNQNIDLIYNASIRSFEVIAGENFSGISFAIDSPRLYREWNQFGLGFNLAKRTLQFMVNGKLAGSSTIPANFACLKFLWGANDFPKFDTKDVPPMQVKDIRISENGQEIYFWTLDESSGDLSYDQVKRKAAKIKNPAWIKPAHQKWELLDSFSVASYAGLAYDSRQDRLCVAGADSLALYTIKNGQNALSWVPSHPLNLRLGNQAIYDTIGNKLYDFYIDQPQVVAFDLSSRKWDGDFQSGKITEFWHVNKFISPFDSCLYVIGGYGQFKYKNLVQRCSLATRKWDMVTPSGDYFSPRYLSALGADPEGDFVYIIGGYGSKTGDQMLAPGNVYDMVRYSVKDRSFKRMFALKPSSTQFTFANSLVIGPRSREYYGLIFPNVNSSSYLQLIRGSLTDSTYTLLANAVPFSFHDVECFTDLYYSPLSNKLLAVLLHYPKEDDKIKRTEVKIYSLNFPPESEDVPLAGKKEGHSRSFFLLFLLGGVAVLTTGVFLFKSKLFGPAQGESSTLSEDSSTMPAVPAGGQPAPPRASIYFFGPFQVFDKEGNDIARLFSPLLKELFLVIATYTIRNGRGISSEELNEILWHDKSEKDAMNNRSVNLTKLKTFLEKIGSCSISKESGYWQLQVPDEDIYIDYKKYVFLLQSAGDPAKGYIHPLAEIMRRGPFLAQTEYNWLDDIKSEISNSGIHICLDYLESKNIKKNPEFAVELANCIFHFDQLNEDALIHKCKNLIVLKRHTLAMNTYQKFLKDYKDIYGTDFDKSFQEIIA